MASVYKQLPAIAVSTSGLATSANQVLTNTKLDSLIALTKVLSHVQSLTIDGTTAQSFTPPTGAKKVKIHADDDNSVNLRVAFGTTASATIGEKFAAGRSEDFDGSATVSIIAESTASNQGVYLVWSV